MLNWIALKEYQKSVWNHVKQCETYETSTCETQSFFISTTTLGKECQKWAPWNEPATSSTPRYETLQNRENRG